MRGLDVGETKSEALRTADLHSISECGPAGQDSTGRHGADRTGGYTPGMKTAVSVPDALFARVERLAQRSRRSRSEVYSAALQEYVARHAPDEVTEALDRVAEQVADSHSENLFVGRAARRVLETNEW